MKKLLSIILSVAMLFSFVLPVSVFADTQGKATLNGIIDGDINDGDDYYIEPGNEPGNEPGDEPDVPEHAIVVTGGEEPYYIDLSEYDQDITWAIEDAFCFCRQNEEDGKIFTIKVPEGIYYVYNRRMCNNAILDLTDNVVLLNDYSNIFMSETDVTEYNGTHDFTILGGELTYAKNYETDGCLIRMAHAKNIRFEGTSFTNNNNSHHIELAACKDVVFEGCTFEGLTGDINKTSGEALQIDILEESEHFALMPEYDGTMNDGITVNNCTFSNLLRGVGTQSAYAGMYHKNINITNCTFDNIYATAISCTNYIDSNISGNTITNCGEGINYYLMKSDVNLKKMYYIADKCSINTNCNSVISNNNVTVKKTSGVTAASPIYVFGNNITADKNAKFKTGNYTVTNITITDNTFNTPEYGIRVYDCKKSLIKNNTVNGVAAVNGTNGIYLDADSDSNKIEANIITGFENGINLKNKSDSNTVTKNKITAPAKNGIILQSGVKSNSVSSNTITSAPSNGIYSNGSKSTSITSNIISKITGNGVCVMASSELTKLDSNNLSDISNNGIYFNASKSSSVNSNIISKAKGHGLCIMSKSELAKCNSNKISDSTKNGLYLDANSKITEFKSNSITKSKGNGISTYGTISNISSNTFTSNQWGIYFAPGAKNSIYKNTYTKNAKGGCYCAGKTNYKFTNLATPSTPTLSTKSKAVTVKWKKVSNATSYQIYRATSKDGTYTKVATVGSKTLSYKNSKLTKGKTYYYKVRAIRKMNSTTLYSPYSAVKSIKVK